MATVDKMMKLMQESSISSLDSIVILLNYNLKLIGVNNYNKNW